MQASVHPIRSQLGTRQPTHLQGTDRVKKHLRAQDGESQQHSGQSLQPLEGTAQHVTLSVCFCNAGHFLEEPKAFLE